ncbi:MAG TPA: phage tail protein [Thermoanaerobaculia bacterium]|nr:phage tail protein [Thermoanaerobaculia bacterium]
MTRRRAVGHPSPPPEIYKPPDLGGSTKTDIPHPEVSRRTAMRYEEREILLPGVDDGPRAIAYGEQRLAGKLQFAYYRSTADELWCVIELCAGECDGLIEVRQADGRSLPPRTATNWDYWWYAGTAAGAVDANLAAVLPSWNEAFAGTSYVVVRLNRFGTLWNATVPDLVWRMRTRKCLKPDTGTYVYSTNVWDQWYDFVRWSEGKGLSPTRVDAASFTAARNADTAAGRKADSHLLLLESASTEDVIQTFRLIARAYWFWDATKYRVVADRPGSAVATYDDRYVSSSTLLDLDRADIFDRPNKVTVWYTDTTNNWQQKPLSLATAAVNAGTEDPIEEEYRLPHIHDPAQVTSLLTYLLNSRQYDVKVRERWMAATADRQLGDIVTRVVESRGLTVPVRLLRRTKNPDNSFDVELFEHNDAKFAEFVLTESPKIASTLPDPSAAPPDVDINSITWTEELYQTPTGDWLPKGTLSFAPPASFPFLDTIEVWLAINGGPQRHWFDTSSSPALTPTLWETGTYTLTLKAKHRITQQVSTGTTKAFSVTGVTGTVPEIVDVGGSTATRYWNAPQTRSVTRYGAAYWSHTGLTTFTAGAVNDGVVTTTSVVTASGTSTLQYDAGVGLTKPFRELTYHHSGTLTTTPAIQYSDNGTAWTSVSMTGARAAYDAGAGFTARTIAWQTAGAHRFWRITFSGVNSFSEFHFAEYLGDFLQVKEYRVYDMRSGTRAHYVTVPAGALPTTGAPVSVDPVTTKVTNDWGSGGSQLSNVLITVVNPAGTESTGVSSTFAQAFNATGGSSPYIPQTLAALTLTNGINATISLPAGPGMVRVSGPTSAFSVGGIASFGGGGVMAILANATGVTMTLLHEYSSASADMRLALPQSRNADVPPGAIIVLGYDSSSLRWRLLTPLGHFSAPATANPTLAIATGTNGLYAGFNAPALDRSFLWGVAGGSGVIREGVAWSWHFTDAGVLDIGTVPWSQVSGKPTTLAGYGITDAAPIVSPAFTGTPTAPTAATTDRTATLATTAFVRNAITTYGGALQGVTAVSPVGGATGVWVGTSVPSGAPVNATSFAATTATIVSVTGAGKLRFLSVGRGSTGAVTVTVTIDGVNIINAQNYSIAGALNTHFNVAIVGAIGMCVSGADTYLYALPDGEGLPFDSSLVITATCAATAYVASAYKLH